MRVASLAAFIGLLGTGVQASESPILPLEAVIAIEVKQTSLDDRTVLAGRARDFVRGSAPVFRLERSYDSESVSAETVQVRRPKGGWIGGLGIVPILNKRRPVVLLLDEECRLAKLPVNILEDADWALVRADVYGRLPLASQLVGAGYAVLIPMPETFRARPELAEWGKLVGQMIKQAHADENSVFLLATHEWAELALRLGAAFKFSGVAIEAPRRLLFRDPKETAGAKPTPPTTDGAEPQAPSPGFTSLRQQGEYLAFARAQRGPLQVILAQNAPEFDVLRKTLLQSLVAGRSTFSVVLLDTWARNPVKPGGTGGRTGQLQPATGVEPVRASAPDADADGRTSDDSDGASDVGFISEREDAQQAPETTASGIKVAQPGARATFDHGPPRDPLRFSYDGKGFETWVARTVSFFTSLSAIKPEPVPSPPPDSTTVPGAGRYDLIPD
jgi:hypothetical protein